ncbi:MAG: dihydroorotase [Alphaproteobacteria bacterium]|nr:dihydroorotase [Alphaproteobacteria bacterium]
MSDRFDLLLRNGTVVSHDGIFQADIGVVAGRIAAIGQFDAGQAEEAVQLDGLHVLPGVIDTQVHFREPGLEHKEDLQTGTAAAAMGGVVAVFEMPNTKPSTANEAEIAEKLRRAAGRTHADHAFFVGATGSNTEELPHLESLPGVAGVKLFMGASTGDLLVDDDARLGEVLRHGRRRMSVHAEDEPRLRARRDVASSGGGAELHPLWRDAESARLATERLLRLARAAGRRVHVLHVTTAEEMELLAAHRDIASVEVTPQHLTLAAPEAYERLGTLAQMNPPIREARHRDALWAALRAGVVDVIGSDHAPHTLEEKRKPYPQSPSGMPGVQTLLPLMLDHVNAGRLSLLRLVDLTSAGPARIFGIAGKGRIARGFDADFSVVDLKRRWRIEEAWLRSRCGWSPFTGMEVTGRPVMTVLRGRFSMREGELSGHPGQPVRFQETLPRS